MKTLSAHVRHPRSVTGISAAVLLGALALTSIVDGLEVSGGASAASVAEVEPTPNQRAMCDECGVVAATRRLAGSDGERMATATAQYEVTVRMRDGSLHTFVEASSVHWRSGERIILIDGPGQAIN